MSSILKHSQERRRCIYCNSDKKKITGEHIFPKWLSRMVKRYPTEKFLMSTQRYPDGRLVETWKNGKPLTLQVKQVCVFCNNGWMKAIEDDSKDIILALAKGEMFKLTPEHQKTLSLWCAMKSITFEYLFDEETRVTDLDDRTLLRETLQIPVGWQVYLGKGEGEFWDCQPKKSSARMVMKGDAQDGRNNIQMTTLKIGQMILLSFNTSKDFIKTSFLDRDGTFRELYPKGAGDILWPALPVIETKDIAELHSSFHSPILRKRNNLNDFFDPDLVRAPAGWT